MKEEIKLHTDQNRVSFYMIYLDGRNGPTKKHKTYLEAREEAIRLCKKHNCRAYILKTSSVVEPVISTNVLSMYPEVE